MEKWIQFAAKINDQIAEMFDEQCENHIDSKEVEDHPEEFIYALSVIAPGMIYNKLTGENKNALEFNHISNTLCMQYLKTQE